MVLHVVLAGGGTAGHVNPMLATAHELRKRQANVSVIGTREGLESTLVPEQGFDLDFIPKVPIPRRPSLDAFSVPSRLKGAIDKARELLEGADVLVGFGGYVAAPTYIAAKSMSIPFVIHEQNVRAGWANRLGARNAAAVALTFSNTILQARRGVTEVTGMPLRSEIMELAERRASSNGREEARLHAANLFGLDPSKPTLLVTGGSLGAQHLNEVVVDSAPRIKDDIQILHVTGKGKSKPVIAEASRIRPAFSWEIVEYLSNMDQAMAASDLVLCRSGAVTVSELGALSVPAFYVPLPIGNGEQKLNAAGHVASGGAIMVEDRWFSTATFEQRVLPLLQDGEQLDRMREASLTSSLGNGTELLCDLIESVV